LCSQADLVLAGGQPDRTPGLRVDLDLEAETVLHARPDQVQGDLDFSAQRGGRQGRGDDAEVTGDEVHQRTPEDLRHFQEPQIDHVDVTVVVADGEQLPAGRHGQAGDAVVVQG